MTQGAEQLDHHIALQDQTKELHDRTEILDEGTITTIDALVSKVNAAVGFHTHEMDTFKGFAAKLAVARRQINRKLEVMDRRDIDPDFLMATSRARKQADVHLYQEIARIGETALSKPNTDEVYRMHLQETSSDADAPGLFVERCVPLTVKEIGDALYAEDPYFDDYPRHLRLRKINDYTKTHDGYRTLESTYVGEMNIPEIILSVDRYVDCTPELRDSVEDALWDDGEVSVAPRFVDDEIARIIPTTGSLPETVIDPLDLDSVRRRPRTMKVPMSVVGSDTQAVTRERRRQYVASSETHHDPAKELARHHEKEPHTLSGKIILLGRKAAEQVVEVFHRAA